MFRKLNEGVKRKSTFFFQIIFGIFLMIFSVFVLLSRFGFIDDSMFFSASFIEFLMIVLGVVLIIDGIKNRHLPERTLGLVIGVVILLFGTLPLFHYMGMLKFLPIIIYLNVNPIILTILLFISALYLIVDRILLLFY